MYTWTNFKSLVDLLSLVIQLDRDTAKEYKISAWNGPRKIKCLVDKSAVKSADQIDFETNYLPAVNSKIKNEVDLNATITTTVSEQSAPVISSKIKVDYTLNSINLPTVSQAMVDLYSYNGTGVLYSISTKCNTSNAIVELVVDSNVVFNITLDNMDDDISNWITYDDNILTYNPSFGIKFNTSVIIRAKASTSSSSKTSKFTLVNIEKVS